MKTSRNNRSCAVSNGIRNSAADMAKTGEPSTRRVCLNIQHFVIFVKRLFSRCERCGQHYRSLICGLYFSCLLYPSFAFAVFEDLGTGARSLGLGGAFVAASRFSECLFFNPAGIAGSDAVDVNLFYTRPFGLAELSSGSAAVILPWGRIVSGAAIQTYGNKKYQETIFTLGSAATFFKDIAIGTNVRYGLLRIAGYGQAGALIIDLGALAKLSEGISWGFAVRNINYACIGQSGEALPQIMQTGISARPAKKITLLMDLYKDVRFPLDLRSGLEISPLTGLALRAAVCTQPSKIACGFGIVFQKLQIDYAFHTHWDLGMSHQFSVNIHIPK
jgi:hypothetical protein